MHLRKEFQSPGLVGPHPRDFKNKCGEPRDLGIFRLRHLFQAGHVPFGNVRLLHKPENFVRVLDDLPLAVWLTVASLANMNSVAFTRKLNENGRFRRLPARPVGPAV